VRRPYLPIRIPILPAFDRRSGRRKGRRITRYNKGLWFTRTVADFHDRQLLLLLPMSSSMPGPDSAPQAGYWPR